MIFGFFKFLEKNEIEFVILNGYEDILKGKSHLESDIDILFKKNEFRVIEKTIKLFCEEEGYKIVQVYHQGVWAKNIFLFDSGSNRLLNLDIYGDLSRKKVIFFKENEIFDNVHFYNEIPILAGYQEFLYYLIKIIDKNDLCKSNFDHLRSLYFKDIDLCNQKLLEFFPIEHKLIEDAFKNSLLQNLVKKNNLLVIDFKRNKKFKITELILDYFRIMKRINKPTGIAISFLGPDGSGKSTIIDLITNSHIPFRRIDYFHLKPLKKSGQGNSNIVTNPQIDQPYSKQKSFIKLFYFLWQYNIGWLTNIFLLKIKSSLVIFDRYYDDILVDSLRYRYGGSLTKAILVRKLIPRPKIYFILTAEADIIYKRKQEVSYDELARQIEAYRLLANGQQYFNIDVNRSSIEVKNEVIRILMKKLNERY